MQKNQKKEKGKFYLRLLNSTAAAATAITTMTAIAVTKYMSMVPLVGGGTVVGEDVGATDLDGWAVAEATGGGC